MEEGHAGQVRAGASDDRSPDIASEKAFGTDQAEERPGSTNADQEAPIPGIVRQVSNRWHRLVRSEEFDKHAKEARERREQWAKAIDHVKVYLKNKEALEGHVLPVIDDDDGDGDGDDPPPSPPDGAPPDETSDEADGAQPEELYGYPRIARILGSDERWLMCRRFGSLQARLILEKQDEIRELEIEIENYDWADLAKNQTEEDPAFDRLTTRRRPDAKEKKARQDLMDRAEEKFKQYAELVAAARKLTCFEKPVDYEFSTVERVVVQAGGMRPSEMEWILFKKGDMISLRGPKEHATLGAMIEKIVNKIRGSQQDLNASLQGNAKSEKWAGYFISGLLFLLVPLMFVVPIYALSRIGDSIGKSIGVLVGFALTFTYVLVQATPAKEHEVLTGAAAYLAVLVVFISSVGGRGP